MCFMPWGPPHNLFELQSKDVQKVPSSGKVSVDDKLECAAVRIVVCDDEAQAPKHTSIVSVRCWCSY
jgi:hypothetical protein